MSMRLSPARRAMTLYYAEPQAKPTPYISGGLRHGRIGNEIVKSRHLRSTTAAQTRMDGTSPVTFDNGTQPDGLEPLYP